MNRLLAVLSLAALCAGCASGPSQAQLEYQAFDRVLSEKVARKQITPAEADLARQQYAGNLRARESNIAANYSAAEAGNAYANNSTMALSAALICAGQRGGHC